MENNTLSQREVEALIDFYLASGVDGFLEEDPVDRFAAPAKPPVSLADFQSPATQTPNSRPNQRGQQPVSSVGQAAQQQERPPQTPPASASPIPAAPQGGAVIPDQDAITSARERALTAQSLDELRELLGTFEGCNLRLTAKNLVFADGNPEAKVMFVGEAPGRDEDIQGKPFVGRSGQLLDRMLTAIELDRSSAYIANVVPWRPPGNRTPTPQETELCKPFIQRQIALANPDVLVFLGAASAKSLLDVKDGIRRLRGQWKEYNSGSRKIPCVATYHPAYLLRSPLEKRLSWRDFLAIRAKLDDMDGS